MIAYWPWLFLLACLLMMMMFMVRVMGRGGSGTRRAGHGTPSPGPGSARPPAARPLTAHEQACIARLERDLAQLRGGGDPAQGDSPTSAR